MTSPHCLWGESWDLEHIAFLFSDVSSCLADSGKSPFGFALFFKAAFVLAGSYRRPQSISATEVEARAALLFFPLRVIKDKGPSKDYFVLRCIGGD